SGQRRSHAELASELQERGRLELLERELAEDRVVRMRDAVGQALAARIAPVVTQVRLEDLADTAVVADLVARIDAGGDEGARGDQLEHRRRGRPYLGGEPPVEDALA